MSKKQEEVKTAIDFHQELAPQWNQKYDRQIFEQRAARLTKVLETSVSPGEHWLDAGCGTGTLSRALVGMGVIVTGYDGSSKMVEISNLQSKKEVQAGKAAFDIVETIEVLPNKSQSVDGIVCSSVIEYLDHPEKCLAEFNRVLKIGGAIVLTAPNRNSLIAICLKTVFKLTGALTGNARPTYMNFSKNHYSANQLGKLMAAHGFTQGKIVFTSFWPSWCKSKFFGGMCLYHGTKIKENLTMEVDQ